MQKGGGGGGYPDQPVWALFMSATSVWKGATDSSFVIGNHGVRWGSPLLLRRLMACVAQLAVWHIWDTMQFCADMPTSIIGLFALMFGTRLVIASSRDDLHGCGIYLPCQSVVIQP